MGQKAKKITDKQYQHAWKMAFAKSIDGLPKKVAQWVDDSVLLRSRYLFTHRENGVRYGHCTHCHKDVVLELGRTYSAADVQNVNCKHKEIGFCPACKSTVEFRDSGRGRKYMYDQKYILFATKLRDGGILVRAGFVDRDYRLDYTTVKTNFFEEYRVYYNTGVDAVWAKRWSYGFHGWEPDWERMATIPEPSSRQPWYTDEKNYAENHYYGFNDETFKNTNLQYAQMSAYMENIGGNPCGWLDTYVKYPVLTEKLVKEGFIRLAVNDSWTNGVVNRRAKTVSAALGLTKKELRELPKKTRDAVLCAQLAKKYGITTDQAIAYRAFDNYCVSQIEKRLPFKKAVKYLEKQNERPYTLCDYWNDCEKLNLDLKREDILLPPDLEQAHQRTIDALAEARRQKELEETRRMQEETRRMQEEFGKRLKKLERDFSFESGGLLIRPARSHAELIDEGSALHHCVATYAKKHLSGQTVIFLSERKASRTSLFIHWNMTRKPRASSSAVACTTAARLRRSRLLSRHGAGTLEIRKRKVTRQRERGETYERSNQKHGTQREPERGTERGVKSTL